MSSNSTQSFRIQVSPKAIEKATKLFNATIEDTINELLQNSRRAGATRIDIDYNDTTCTIKDNGKGIFKDKCAIALGESGWEKDIVRQEDPAGMGIFSLAQRGAIIMSAGLCVQLEPEHFCGKKDVIVHRGNITQGTSITFPLFRQEIRYFKNVVSDCVRYYPVNTYLNGQQLERKNFLEEAVYEEYWHGLKIGIKKYWGFSREGINFHGHTINLQIAWVDEGNNRYWAAIDVVNAPELQLVLPTRKEVIQNEFFNLLKDECYRIIYRYISTLESHDLAYKDFLHAASLGVQLPEAKKQLYKYEPERGNSESSFKEENLEDIVLSQAVVVSALCDPSIAQIFYREFCKWQSNCKLYNAAYKYEGYSWYDSLPKLSNIALSIESKGQRIDLDDALEIERCLDLSTSSSILVDRIWIEANLSTNSGKKTIQVSTDLAVHNNPWHSIEEVKVFLTKNSDINVEELTELLEAAYFTPSEDSDADSYYTQKEHFEEESLEIATKVLLSPKLALEQRLKAVVEKYIRWIVPHNQKVAITIDKTIKITLLE